MSAAETSTARRLSAVLAGLAVVSALLLALSLWLAQDENQVAASLRAHGVSAAGVVTDLRTETGRGASQYLSRVTIRFTDPTGQPAEHDLSYVSGAPDDLTIGQQVRVVYDPTQPSTVLLAGQLRHRVLGGYLPSLVAGIAA